MNDQQTSKIKVCPQCGYIDAFGCFSDNCSYCHFELISIEHSFVDIVFNPFNKNKDIPTIEEIETKYIKNSPYFRQDIWESRKKQEAENRQRTKEQEKIKKKNLSVSNMSICRTCGCVYKGKSTLCNYCKSSEIAELDMTGADWEALSLKKQQNKNREVLLEYCYKYDGFNREKWKQRIIEHENSLAREVAKAFNPDPNSHAADYNDFLLTEGKKCPVCGSDQIQVANRYGRFVIKTKMICLKCKTIF